MWCIRQDALLYVFASYYIRGGKKKKNKKVCFVFIF